ncbi:MAG: hypothetical protein ACR2K1_13980 [Saprospiraceae bacterium]
MDRYGLIFWIFCSFFVQVAAQTDSAAVSPWRLRGYVKNLQLWNFSSDRNSLLSGGFFHHRLQLRYAPEGAWSGQVDVRNRLFYGDWVRAQPYLPDQLDTDNGLLDLSFVPVKRPALVGSVLIDRLYGQFQCGRWQVRLGRQRINWGMALTWNPNDWFNAYNFLDFDYEERPGSDALRVQYQTGGFGELDLALSSSGSGAERQIGALRYGTHTGRFDWQLLVGVYRRYLALGAGWAGDVGKFGFKGEASLFRPLWSDSLKTIFSTTLSLDYMTSKQLFLSAGLLINTNGQGGATDLARLSQTNLSPTNLMPGKISGLASVNYPFTPLLTGSLTTVYAPNGHLLICIPALGWSVAQNFDLDLTGQLFWLEESGGSVGNAGNGLFLRGRWSY